MSDIVPFVLKQHKLELGERMKKLRVFLATALMSSAFIVVGAGPASANCEGDPVNPCVLVCEVGGKWANKFLPCDTW